MRWGKEVRAYTQFLDRESINDVLLTKGITCGSKLLYVYFYYNKKRKYTLNDIMKHLSVSDVSIWKYMKELKSIDLLADSQDDEYIVLYVGTHSSPASKIKDMYTRAMKG